MIYVFFWELTDKQEKLTYYKLIKINNIRICLAAVYIGKLNQHINHTFFSEQNIVCTNFFNDIDQIKLSIQIVLCVYVCAHVRVISKVNHTQYAKTIFVLYPSLAFLGSQDFSDLRVHISICNIPM